MERSAALVMLVAPEVLVRTTMGATGRVTTPASEVAAEARTVEAGEAESHGIMTAQRQVPVGEVAALGVIGALANDGRAVVEVEAVVDSAVATEVAEADASAVERKYNEL